MAGQLIAAINGVEIGRVTEGKDGRLTFTYLDAWRERPDAYPLSLSLPLVSRDHRHEAISSFLWGLLPDNERILGAWARRFGVSARNPFRLVAYVGEELAGAVQFMRPDRIDTLRAGSTATIQWVTDSDVAARLRALRTDAAAWRRSDDVGQFSLAGAQPKIALLLRDGRWGIPSGRIPTTHIFKPPLNEFDGFAENEHLCLELAGALGMPVAQSQVMTFEDQTAIVIKRYDRIDAGEETVRVHQEDTCQALGIPPTSKYESDGGPGIPDIVELLRSYSQDAVTDVSTFVRAQILNWVIGGTDAHAKNYSVLIGASTVVRLAPLYDIVSALPYPSLSPHKIKLAMKIGGEFLVRRVGRRQWEKSASELRLGRDELVDNVVRTSEIVGQTVHEVCGRARSEGLLHPLVTEFEEQIATRAAACVQSMARGATADT